MRTCLVLVPLLLSACMNDAGPRKALADAVHRMNDAARWGRIGTALSLVDSGYQVRFREAHSGWGERLQLADSDVVQVDMTGENTATAVVSYSWYNLGTMTLHTTVVQQRWVRTNEAFVLVDEVVVKGDGSLLAPPAPEASG
ncbi:MAG: hypothetical protein OXU20_28100 [Myxococcales bacterium]|nr:hypothetical protein [Myxococcales bacterium]MDD9965983.1 hypothetical protein [Myxococcales bacterium]